MTRRRSAACSSRRPFHDVREGRILLSRESRPHGRDHASGAAARADRRRRRRRIGRGAPEHPSMAEVTLCEIDAAVIDISQRYLGEVHRGALDDPRVTLESATASPTSANRKRATTYRARSHRSGRPVDAALHERLLPCLRREARAWRCDDAAYREPCCAPRPRSRGVARLREVFACVTPYLASIPLYGGLWMMACASATLDPKVVWRPKWTAASPTRRRSSALLQRRHHRAALALPNSFAILSATWIEPTGNRGTVMVSNACIRSVGCRTTCPRGRGRLHRWSTGNALVAFWTYHGTFRMAATRLIRRRVASIFETCRSRFRVFLGMR